MITRANDGRQGTCALHGIALVTTDGENLYCPECLSPKATVHSFRNEKIRTGDPNDVYIGRAPTSAPVALNLGFTGYFGNPFVLQKGEPRGATIDRFEKYARERLATDSLYRERVRELHGKRLFCFCAPQACHGDVLATLAEELHNA